MNIFALDEDPLKAAKYHNNKHVVKMILETAQILCTVYHKQDVYTDLIPYRKTHENHPCTVWANERRANFDWLVDLGFYLHQEWQFRFNHEFEEHKSFKVIQWCENHKDNLTFNDYDQTPFALAMPENCQVNAFGFNDPIASYRRYYIDEKSHMAEWGKRGVPKWWSK